MSDCLFYIFATIAVAAAVFMISARSAVNSAVGMIVALVAVAADFFLLDAPFLGVIQILVYAGAVMVLFLFIIMLLDVDKAARAPRSKAKWITGALIALALTGGVAYALTHGGLEYFAEAPPADVADSVNAPLPFGTTVRDFGRGLFTKYMLPIQIAGFLLLSAMVGVVAIAKRSKDAA